MEGVSISGKEYISSKRAAELCGYAQDYVGQLARSGAIEAQRMGGLWYVYLESLQAYKNKAESIKHEPPVFKAESIVDSSTVELDGKTYVSASQAAKLTQYNQDYIGQLARAGKIDSRQIGNRWYIDTDELVNHKKEKDALLAAVQAESVGLKRPEQSAISTDGSNSNEITPSSEPSIRITYGKNKTEVPLLSYSIDTRDLLPALKQSNVSVRTDMSEVHEITKTVADPVIPIRIVDHSPPVAVLPNDLEYKGTPPKRRTSRQSQKPIFGALMITFMIIFAGGMLALNGKTIYSTYSKFKPSIPSNASTAAAAGAFNSLSQAIESVINPEIQYSRAR